MILCLLCPLLGQGDEYALGNHSQGDRNVIKDELCDASLFSQLEVGAPKLLVVYVIKGFEELSLFSKYLKNYPCSPNIFSSQDGAGAAPCFTHPKVCFYNSKRL